MAIKLTIGNLQVIQLYDYLQNLAWVCVSRFELQLQRCSKTAVVSLSVILIDLHTREQEITSHGYGRHYTILWYLLYNLHQPHVGLLKIYALIIDKWALVIRTWV